MQVGITFLPDEDDLKVVDVRIRRTGHDEVPERREELTTEGGLDVASQRENITKLVKHLQDGEVVVSIFIASSTSRR